MLQQFKQILSLIILSGLLSTTNGQNWQLLGLDDQHIYSIAVHPEHPDTIYAGSLGYLFMSSNGGITWDTLLTNRSIWNISIHPEDPQKMYIADDSIKKTIDGGQNWFSADSGIYLVEDQMYSIAIDPDYPDTMFAGSVGFAFGGRIFKSTNGGDFWVSISDTVTQLHYSIAKIAIHPQNTQIVLVGTAGYDGDVMRTKDGGSTWLPTGLQLDAVYDIEFDLWNPDVVYAGGLTGGFYKSEDAGVSWTDHNNGLPAPILIRGIEIDHATTQLFLAAYDTVYQSLMTPIHWSEINDGLPPQGLVIRSMELDSVISTLYLGTNQGIYAYDVLTHLDDGDIENPETFVLYQNYPNPFNPETTIEFYLPHSAEVRLEVFNVLGQKIRTLMNRRKVAGMHQAKWDGRDDAGAEVSSGLYIYRLKVEDQIISQKMLLLR